MSQDMTDFTDRAGTREETEEAAKLEVRKTIALGMDMEAFLASDVGKYLSACAEQDLQIFRKQLDDLDPDDSKAIRDLQQEIAVRKTWKDWIMLAINEGNAAQDIALERNSL